MRAHVLLFVVLNYYFLLWCSLLLKDGRPSPYMSYLFFRCSRLSVSMQLQTLVIFDGGAGDATASPFRVRGEKVRR